MKCIRFVVQPSLLSACRTLFLLQTETLYLTTIAPHSLLPPLTGSHHATICFYDLDNSNYLIGEGNSTLLQYSCLENPMDGGAWWAAVHGVSRSQTRLSDVTFTFHFPALEKEMVTHSSVLAWRIPGTGEPGGLPSMGSHRVGHNRSDLAVAAAC